MATPLIDSQIDDITEILDEIESKKEDGKFANQAAVNKQIEEAEGVLKQMSVEIHNVKGPRKAEVQGKMREFRSRIDDYKKIVLMSSSKGRNMASATEEDRAADSLDKLSAARQQLAETEEVARQTAEELAKQRETIQRARSNNKEIQAELGRSNGMITKMSKWWRG
jgi:vesicle transport through interaction with t-SNAREs protein 1